MPTAITVINNSGNVGTDYQVARDIVGGFDYQYVKQAFGADGTATIVSAANPLPVTHSGTITVTGGLTDAQLRATPVPVSGTVTVNVGLTDAQLRATPVPVSGTVAVTGALTDAQLRATAVPISVATVPSHPVTNAGTFATQETGALLTSSQLIDDGIGTVAAAIPTKGMAALGTDGTNGRILKTDAAGELQVDVLTMPTVTVTGGLTDAQLRATPVPVSGTVTVNVGLTDAQLRATAVPVSLTSTTVTGSVAVTGPVTDAQLRATPVPISGTVAISSVIPGFSGTALGKREDDIHSSLDTGVMALGVRRDTPTALAADGDYMPPTFNSTGHMYVTGAGGGTQYNIDDVASATATGTVALVVRKDTGASLAGTDGDVTGLQVDATGNLRVIMPAGASGLTDAELRATAVPVSLASVPSHPVTNAGTFATQEGNSAAILTSVQLIDDGIATVAAAITTKGMAAIGTDGTNARILKTDAGGELQVDVLTMPTVTVTGALTDAQLRATPVPVSGTVSVTGVATEGTLATLVTSSQLIDDTVATVAAAIPTKGQAAVGTDGTNARILKTDASGELQVDVLTMPSVAVTGPLTDAQLRATPVPVSGTVTINAIPAGGNNIGDVDVLSIVPGVAATNLGKREDDPHASLDTGVMALGVRADTQAATAANGDYVPMIFDAAGGLWVAGTQLDDAAFTPGTGRVGVVGLFADEASTDLVDEGDVGVARMTLDRKQIMANYAHTAGGATPHKLVSAATTNATSLKASAGQVYLVVCTNVNAAVRYLKLYNKASAPTVGTDVPVQTYGIPGNTAGAGHVIPIPACGLEFTTGIAYALTTEATDAGSSAVAASEIVVNIGYK